MKIGLLREYKEQPDKRVALTPKQCSELQDLYPGLSIVVQSSDDRSYTDQEYLDSGIDITSDVSGCDVLLGIKEVPESKMLEGKTYMYFSHTIKKQPHNRTALQAILKKNITLVDYECLTDNDGNRVIGFGRYAGIVGAYNGIRGYGRKYDLFQLKPAHQCRDIKEVYDEMTRINLPNLKILVTGGGRVANGAMETLGALKIRKVTPYEVINFSFREPVYAQLHSKDYHATLDGSPWNNENFYANPGNFKSTFNKYLPICDILMHCAYWNPEAPVLFTPEQMNDPSFRISVIADITCDIKGSIPSTVRASTIQNPFYGFNPVTRAEDVPFGKHTITVMAVDNLPCELPRDASESFGKHLMERVLPALFNNDKDGLIARATIATQGHLTKGFNYLSDYVKLDN